MSAEHLDKGRLFTSLKDAVSIKSIAPNEQLVAEFFEDTLIQRGFKVERQAVDGTSRYNLFAEKGQDAKVLFYGHMDTVDSTQVVTPEKWLTDPLKLENIEGNLFGLGASDMKGGISAFIEAASISKTPTKIFLAVDEEEISKGAWKAVSERREFFDGLDLIISAESSFNLGLNAITVGRTGRSVYEVTFIGKTEHIIKYKEAIDAIEKLCSFGNLLYLNREKMFKSPDTVAQLRKIRGESVGMSVAGEAGAEIEVLLGAEDSTQGVLEKLQELTDDKVRVKPRETKYLEGYEFISFPYKDILSQLIKDGTGKAMTLHKRKSVGDDNVLATLKIPVLTWGPVGDNEHKPNEYVNFQSLILLTTMYTRFLDNLGNKQK